MPTKNIHQSIAAVMAEVGGVAKGRTNQQQNYQFRGIADVYLATQPVMAKHGMHVSPHKIADYAMDELKTAKGNQMWRVRIKVTFRAYAEDGSFVEVETLGEAMDTGDKASNKAMSAAMKYCLVQLFALPEEDPSIDTESDSPESLSEPRQEFDLWAELDKAGVPAESAARRAWCERALGRDLPLPDSIKDTDIGTLLDIALKRKPLPPERAPKPTDAQLDALNKAVDALAPWGAKALDGLTQQQQAAKRKNAKLAWASALVKPIRRVASFKDLTLPEVEKLMAAAANGEMPADDPLPAWMETQPKE